MVTVNFLPLFDSSSFEAWGWQVGDTQLGAGHLAQVDSSVLSWAGACAAWAGWAAGRPAVEQGGSCQKVMSGAPCCDVR